MNVATIGYFDGVHLGHQRLINKVVELAEKENLTPAVYTFNSFVFPLFPNELKV